MNRVETVIDTIEAYLFTIGRLMFEKETNKRINRCYFCTLFCCNECPVRDICIKYQRGNTNLGKIIKELKKRLKKLLKS